MLIVWVFFGAKWFVKKAVIRLNLYSFVHLHFILFSPNAPSGYKFSSFKVNCNELSYCFIRPADIVSVDRVLIRL